MTLGDGVSIGVIGGGMMAEAFVSGLVRTGGSQAASVTVGEPVPTRREYLSMTYGVQTTDDNAMAVRGADVVLLAVKPQVLDAALTGLDAVLRRDTLVVSIVAGVTIATLRQRLGSAAIVRAMPNTPGQVGEGITVWTSTAETSDAQRDQADEILSALGERVAVDDEAYLDMATAVSGSGPAYVFLFIEALADAAVHVGFARDTALKLALQTVRGSAIYAQSSDLHLAELRNRVTSPGGTTAAALAEFEGGALRAVVDSAVRAAFARARELGEMSKK